MVTSFKKLASLANQRKLNLINFIRTKLRHHFVTIDEELQIAFAKVFLDTTSYFRAYKEGPIVKYPIIGFNMKERFCISDIYVGVGKHQFGYIQKIEVDLKNNYVQIGHIATNSEFTRIGLGKRLALAIGEYVNKLYGIDKIHFCESSQGLGHPHFFANVLGAKNLKANGHDKWIWSIPKS